MTELAGLLVLLDWLRLRRRRKAQNRQLEAAVGEALGEARPGARTDREPRSSEIKVPISNGDRMRFRLMARYREAWWP